MDEQKDQKQIKAEEFAKNPDSFIHINELMMAVKKNPQGQFEVLVNPATRHDLMCAKEELLRAYDKTLTVNEIRSMEANKPKVVRPSIVNRVKGAFGGGAN